MRGRDDVLDLALSGCIEADLGICLVVVAVDVDSDIDIEGRGGVPGSRDLVFPTSWLLGFTSVALGSLAGGGSVPGSTSLFLSTFFLLSSAGMASLDSLSPGSGVAHLECLSFLGFGGVFGMTSGPGSTGGGVGIRKGSAGKAEVDPIDCESLAGPEPFTSGRASLSDQPVREA